MREAWRVGKNHHSGMCILVKTTLPGAAELLILGVSCSDLCNKIGLGLCMQNFTIKLWGFEGVLGLGGGIHWETVGLQQTRAPITSKPEVLKAGASAVCVCVMLVWLHWFIFKLHLGVYFLDNYFTRRSL